MKAVHKRALNFAANHFATSFVIGLVCLLYFYGAGLSDVYHPDPFWIKLLVVLLWVLQLPVAIFETIALQHSKFGANVLLLCVLGFLWSLCLGYLVPWLVQIVRNKTGR
jgi:uncharacterized membrane protein (UPF0182 family)